MKKILFTVLFLSLQLSLLFAQQGPGRRGHQIKDRVARLKEELSLTDDQSKKIETIFTDKQKEMNALVKKQKEEMEKFRKEMDALKESSEKELLNVLNDEQKEDYNSIVNERQGGMGFMPPLVEQHTPPMGEMMESMRQGNHQMGFMPGHPMGMQRPQSMGLQAPPAEQMTGQPFGQKMTPPPPPEGAMRGKGAFQQDQPAPVKAKKAVGIKSQKKAGDTEK